MLNPLILCVLTVATPWVAPESPAAPAFAAGLAQHFAFNDVAASGAFAAGLAADPSCGMCVWGLARADIASALRLGRMPSAKHAQALAAIQQSLPNGLPARLVAATLHYLRSASHQSLAIYADTLRDLWADHPQDVDLAVHLADTLSNVAMVSCHGGGHLGELQAEMVTVLEAALALNPNHAGAHHLYIHAVEASDQPERALTSATVLPGLAPEYGHLVHMPSHIWLRLGRYEAAACANLAALRVDAASWSDGTDPGDYYDIFHLHSRHFLWSSLLMLGRHEAARVVAHQLVAGIRPQTRDIPFLHELYAAAPAFGRLRQRDFSDTDEAAAMPTYARMLNTLARGLAALAADDRAAAEEATEQLRQVTAQAGPMFAAPGAVAVDLLTAECAVAAGDWPRATEAYQAAIDREDALPYMEPWLWQLPIREFYAAALLAHGDAAEALAVSRAELTRHPANTYAWGHERDALVSLNRFEEAAAVDDQLRAVASGPPLCDLTAP